LSFSRAPGSRDERKFCRRGGRVGGVGRVRYGPKELVDFCRGSKGYGLEGDGVVRKGEKEKRCTPGPVPSYKKCAVVQRGTKKTWEDERVWGGGGGGFKEIVIKKRRGEERKKGGKGFHRQEKSGRDWEGGGQKKEKVAEEVLRRV